MNDLNIYNCTNYGNGPRENVLLLSRMGLGDVLHAMPVVQQLMRDGFNVTVNAESFTEELWRLIGVNVIVGDGRKRLRLDEVAEARKKYHRIVTLDSWSTWEIPLRRDSMEILAEALGTTVPDAFSWIDAIQPVKTFESYVVFAPQSTEACRSLPEEQAREIYEALKSQYGNVVWITHGFPTVSGEFELEMNNKICSLLTREKAFAYLAQYRENKRIRAEAWSKDKTTFSNLRDLMQCVYNAERVISVESGVSNLAGAFAKELTVICGPTTPEYILGQYKRFHPLWSYDAIQAQASDGCERCWRSFTTPECGSTPRCLSTVTSQQIFELTGEYDGNI